MADTPRKKSSYEDDPDLTLVDHFVAGFKPIVEPAPDGTISYPREEYLRKQALLRKEEKQRGGG